MNENEPKPEPKRESETNMTLAQVQHMMEIDEEEIWNTAHEPTADNDTELDELLTRAMKTLHAEVFK